GQADRFRVDPDGGGTAETPVSAVHVGPRGMLYFARGGTLFQKPVGGRAAGFGRPRGVPAGGTRGEGPTGGRGRPGGPTRKHRIVLAAGGSRFERRDEGLGESSEVGRLAFDAEGRLLVPTVHGLAYERDGAWRAIGRREGLAADTALSALVDAEGSLWVGLLGGGLTQRIGHGEFTNWPPLTGFSPDAL